VIKAVDKHQGLLRASVAGIGQDHRLGANEAPPAIISIFLGAELEKVFGAIVSGEGDPHTPASVLGLGTPVLPPLPMHGGDRNRTSPFAFTGNKFEFRTLGSSQSLAFPNTVLNTIAAEAIDELADQLEAKLADSGDLDRAVTEVVRDAYGASKRIVFGGDNYSEDWHSEAESRGLKNLSTTVDALPEVLTDQTLSAFEKYEVLSHRELESRYEVWMEQYTMRANIESETAASMARTMLLPAALRQVALEEAAGMDALASETRAVAGEFVDAIVELETANVYPDDVEGLDLAIHARDRQLTALERVRELGDALEKLVADDLWPLPKYAEILFIK
jgi:glutamine synthetase